MQITREQFKNSFDALGALIGEYNRVVEAAAQGVPLDAVLVRDRLMKIETMHDAAVA